jgi:hypothetical protein
MDKIEIEVQFSSGIQQLGFENIAIYLRQELSKLIGFGNLQRIGEIKITRTAYSDTKEKRYDDIYR